MGLKFINTKMSIVYSESYDINTLVLSSDVSLPDTLRKMTAAVAPNDIRPLISKKDWIEILLFEK